MKFHLVRRSAIWFLVSMYLIWIFGSRLIRSNRQSRATLWVLETCLIVGLLPFNDHRDHCFIVFELKQQSILTRGLDVWGNRINILQYVDLPLSFFDFCQYQQVALFYLKFESRFQKQKQLDPTTPEQATRLISIQCPKRWSQILLNCAKRQFVSCTSNRLEQMYDFQTCTMVHLM